MSDPTVLACYGRPDLFAAIFCGVLLGLVLLGAWRQHR